MKLHHFLIGIVGSGLLLIGSGLASDEPTTPSAGPDPAPKAMTFTIDENVVRMFIKRGAFDLAQELEMDQNQEAQLQKVMTDRWMPFFEKNHEQLEPLVNRWMKAMIDPDPPAVDEVQSWAKDMLKLQDSIQTELQQGQQDIAKLLTPEQIPKYRKQVMQLNAGMGMFQMQLHKWANGQVDLSLWDRNNKERLTRRKKWQEENEKKMAEQSTSSEMLALSVDAWDQYVMDFIKKFDLDETQRQIALGILKNLKDRAELYVGAHRDELDKTIELLNSTAGNRKDLFELHSSLLKPIQDLFSELQTRLNGIPTENQRQKASNPQPPTASLEQ